MRGLVIRKMGMALYTSSFDATASERVRINADGNVGIGTTSPKARLQVVTPSDTSGTPTAYDDKYFTVGQGGTTDGNVFISYDNTNNRGYIGALSPSVAWRNLILNPGGGNVGIGTVSPERQFHVLGGTADNSSTTIRIGGSTNHTSRIELAESVYSGVMSYGFTLTTDGGAAGGSTNNFLLRNHNNSSVGNVAFSVERVNGYVGIGTESPKAPLHVGDSSKGNYFGGKTVSLSTSYADALSIELPNHTAAYVKVFLNGDWSSHSSIAYVGEYMIQNGANSYNEPGIIITEFDNTYNGTIDVQIVDSSTDTFVIQMKLSTTGSFTGQLSYHVMGAITSIS